MKKKSFFEKLTGVVRLDDEQEEKDSMDMSLATDDDSDTEGELAVDMYEAPTEIIVKTMVAGVKPEDLDISITRDMVTIKGKGEESHDVTGNDFFHKELYWGSFSRTI